MRTFLPKRYTVSYSINILIRLLAVLSLFSSLLQHPSKQTNLKWERLPEPSSTLCVISNVITSVWMQQCRQGAPIDHQPWDESAKLSWRKEVDFEHGNGMRTDWLIPNSVYAQLGDCGGKISPRAPLLRVE